MKKTILSLFCILIAYSLFAQLDQPPFTPAVERIKSFDTRQALQENSLAGTIEFRSAGPTIFSGRVVDLAVHPEDPSHFLVAYASGGLWKTESNGSHFSPLFDQEMVMTIGAVAADWERNTIWLGTGEVNSSRSSYAGLGVYLSEDGGKTWTHKGLGESHHIGRILLHPTDPNTVWVAVLGHLYSPNKERGIYKTTDGGNTWNQVLFVNDDTGAIDLILDPNDPDVLYAATWERTRRAWNFIEAGAGSGIFKSSDGGETWGWLTDKRSGFPTGNGVGRIGLTTTTDEDGETVLYALLDNYDRRPKEEEAAEDGLTKDQLRTMSKPAFLNLDKKLITDYLKANNFPKKYSSDKVIEMVEQDEIKPSALVEYIEDANSLLFDTPVIGAEVYRSTNGGKKWKKTHTGYLDRVYNSYGYYFGQIRVQPQNPDQLYIMGVPILSSEDGGNSWKSINGDNVHVDHHALWVNPERPGHLILGNDGGINISYDNGESWFKCNSPAVGQFYTVAIDHAEPYNIYGGLQDNGVWVGPHTYEASSRWHSTGFYPYQLLIGGDGMQVAIDKRDNTTVYTGFQFGNYFRINKNTKDRSYITPKHELGERPLRWNWQAPIHLSEHNQDILYMGSNKVHRSFNQGEDFEEISEDLTTGGKKGDVAFSTLTSIHESPLKFGLLYAGSDDGLVHVSRDGGNSWVNISAGLPDDMWVSRVQASSHELGRVYVSLNGYRWDNFAPMVYMSDDYGANWKRIGQDLPLEPVNVIKEDPVNQNLLYVGTDHGLYCSLDRGTSFMGLGNGIPAVPIHDLVVHPTAGDLVVGTHGRSIYVGSVQELQALDRSGLAKKLIVFTPEKVRYNSRWGNSSVVWRAAEDPEIDIPVYSASGGPIEFTIVAGEDLIVKTFTRDAKKGLDYLPYHLDIAPDKVTAYTDWLNKDVEDPVELKESDTGRFFLQKGSYTIKVKQGEETAEVVFEIN